ncbi:hypothetical protein P0R31_16305 [Bradyrhizobium yuanmingense]|nr:hypothetical protein [Bradyrhizobium yuanmingense]MDF0518796.1 hypothetical protein [Bradyrhizobium yuanmingense]
MPQHAVHRVKVGGAERLGQQPLAGLRVGMGAAVLQPDAPRVG